MSERQHVPVTFWNIVKSSDLIASIEICSSVDQISLQKQRRINIDMSEFRYDSFAYDSNQFS